MKKTLLATLFCTMICLGADTNSNWQAVLAERLPAYGHRNWIVIADSAYPAQARDGIETIVADANQVHVLEVVLAALAKSRHVTPIIHTDQELKYLDDEQAPGVGVYRDKLAALFQDKPVESEPHSTLIEKLDEVLKKVRTDCE